MSRLETVFLVTLRLRLRLFEFVELYDNVDPHFSLQENANAIVVYAHVLLDQRACVAEWSQENYCRKKRISAVLDPINMGSHQMPQTDFEKRNQM